MKNYESLVEFVTKKRVVRAPIKSILVVDQESHMEGVLKIWKEQKSSNPESKVLLKRPLSDQEKLLKSFGSE